jgi:hypothetical protein
MVGWIGSTVGPGRESGKIVTPWDEQAEGLPIEFPVCSLKNSARSTAWRTDPGGEAAGSVRWHSPPGFQPKITRNPPARLWTAPGFFLSRTVFPGAARKNRVPDGSRGKLCTKPSMARAWTPEPVHARFGLRHSTTCVIVRQGVPALHGKLCLRAEFPVRSTRDVMKYRARSRTPRRARSGRRQPAPPGPRAYHPGILHQPTGRCSCPTSTKSPPTRP